MTTAPTALRLLVVDDEEDVCFAMRSYFSGRGYQVDTASSLEAAVACLATATYRAVVADLRLSGSDGEEGLELLRHVRATSDIPFLLITGFGTPAVAAEAMRLGVSSILVKPQPLSEIAFVLRALLPRAV